jgi:hypothetical protein
MVQRKSHIYSSCFIESDLRMFVCVFQYSKLFFGLKWWIDSLFVIPDGAMLILKVVISTHIAIDYIFPVVQQRVAVIDQTKSWFVKHIRRFQNIRKDTRLNAVNPRLYHSRLALIVLSWSSSVWKFGKSSSLKAPNTFISASFFRYFKSFFKKDASCKFHKSSR